MGRAGFNSIGNMADLMANSKTGFTDPKDPKTKGRRD